MKEGRRKEWGGEGKKGKGGGEVGPVGKVLHEAFGGR